MTWWRGLPVRQALASTFTLVLLLWVSGCRAPRPAVLSPEEVESHATRTLAAPPEEVFPACVAALEQMGYSVALEDRAKGLIRTRALPARTGPHRERYRRMYEITVSTAPERSSVVVAGALLLEGTAPLGEAAQGTVWTIEQERAEAARFFRAVDEALVERRHRAAASGQATF